MMLLPFDLIKYIIDDEGSRITVCLSTLLAAKEPWVVTGKKMHGIIFFPPSLFTMHF